MPTTLSKTKKQIAKKRGGDVSALHEKSRNSMRLHKASIRDQKLEKLAASRNKKEQPIADRVAYFQVNLKEEGGQAVDMEQVQTLIDGYIAFTEEEYAEAKKDRRPGRPASAREDMLKMKLDNLREEHAKGFALPDITTKEGAAALMLWEGSWSYLGKISWVRVTKEGALRKSEFPSKGIV